MSEQMAGNDEAGVQGYLKALYEVRKIVLEQRKESPQINDILTPLDEKLVEMINKAQAG